jgi:uncharacterized protein
LGISHLGHKTGFEFWRLRRWAEFQCIDQEEVDALLQDPEHYQFEQDIESMSHNTNGPGERVIPMSSDAEVDAKDRDGRTELMKAAFGGRVDRVVALIARGADPNAADHNGWTSLHMAAERHQVEVAELLLKAGAAIDTEDKHGNTPLARAVFVSRGRGEMIRLLLAKGADKSHANRYGISPLSLAQDSATPGLEALLQQ